MIENKVCHSYRQTFMYGIFELLGNHREIGFACYVFLKYLEIFKALKYVLGMPKSRVQIFDPCSEWVKYSSTD